MNIPTWGKTVIGLLAVVVGLMFGMYAAGFFFLVANKTNPFNAELTTIYQYWYYYQEDPSQTGRFRFAFAMGGLVATVMPFSIIVGLFRSGRALHGDARFANAKEIKKAGLNGNTGIFIGRAFGKFLILGGQLFAALAAPTRSGKGVAVVIPNLLMYGDSVVVSDVKMENFLITSGYRAKYGQEVYLFNPFAEDGKTHRWNPLSYINANPHYRVSDILAIGYVLYPQEGKDAFWNDQARNLFLGLVLYLVETPELPRTISEALRQSSGKGKPIKKYLNDLIAERDNSERPLSDACVEALLRFSSNSENTLASILGSFNAPLTIWANPIVDAATSGNDFWLTDLRKKRMTIYLGVTPDKLSQASLIMNLFFSQIINLNTKELPENNPELKYHALLLKDEFTAMGKVEIYQKAVSYMAGYNLRLLPIFQSISQLVSVYGENEARTLMTNHACQILFAPREQKDANEYSEMLGYMTEKSTSTSSNSKGVLGVSLSGNSRGESVSDQRRALLLPQELKELGTEKLIVSLENTKPILAEKVFYYNEPVFVDRLKEVSPSLAKIKGIPTREQLKAAITSGELAVPIPVLDLDLHMAKIETRVRFLTEADLAQDGEGAEGADDGFDLDALAHDFTDLPELDAANPSEEEVKEFVSSFFATLEDRTAPVDTDDADEGTDSFFSVPDGMREIVDEDGVVSHKPKKVVAAVAGSAPAVMDLSILDDGPFDNAYEPAGESASSAAEAWSESGEALDTMDLSALDDEPGALTASAFDRIESTDGSSEFDLSVLDKDY